MYLQAGGPALLMDVFLHFFPNKDLQWPDCLLPFKEELSSLFVTHERPDRQIVLLGEKETEIFVSYWIFLSTSYMFFRRGSLGHFDLMKAEASYNL